MIGVWAVLTVVTIFFGLPGILGTYVLSTRGSHRLLNGWITFMVASLAIELALTVAVMVLT